MLQFQGIATLAALIVLNAKVTNAVACNNSPDLCSRSYGNITQLGAHDSPFVRNATNNYIISGNQFYNTTTQLSAGVRLVTAQVHKYNSALHLCHSDCRFYDAGLLSDWLASIGRWLDQNTNDVVTVLLVNADAATATDLGQQYQTANVVRYSYTPTSKTATADWPTLQTLIDKNTRLLSFIADMNDNSAAPYLMDEFTYAFENRYDNKQVSDYSCTLDRPASLSGNTNEALASGRLPIVNHFLYQDLGSGIEIPAVANLSTTNAAGSQPGTLGEIASRCASEYQRAPAFLLVDFFNVASPISVVDSLNNVVGKTEGRLEVSNNNLQPGLGPSSTSTSAGTTQVSSTAATGVTPSRVSTAAMSTISTSSPPSTSTGAATHATRPSWALGLFGPVWLVMSGLM